jgi:hypothetical protein
MAQTKIRKGQIVALTTADVSASTDKNYVTDAEKVIIAATTASYTTAEASKLAGIETGADVTDATNVNAAGAVMNSDYTTAHSLLVQQSGTGTPSVLQVPANSIVGNDSTGDIIAMTATQVRTLINVENGADVTDAGNVGSVNAAAASKTTPVDADSFPIVNSESANVIGRVTFTNFKAFLKTYFDTIYAALAGSVSQSFGALNIELGHASDTTLSRSAAGVIAVEGVVIPSISSTNTLTNKRITKRTGTTTSSATPTLNTDDVDEYYITAQTADITSFTTNLSGTNTLGQTLFISVKGTAARAITWGASFANGPVALPTTTITTTELSTLFKWDGSVWRCYASGSTV